MTSTKVLNGTPFRDGGGQVRVHPVEAVQVVGADRLQRLGGSGLGGGVATDSLRREVKRQSERRGD